MGDILVDNLVCSLSHSPLATTHTHTLPFTTTHLTATASLLRYSTPWAPASPAHSCPWSSPPHPLCECGLVWRLWREWDILTYPRAGRAGRRNQLACLGQIPGSASFYAASNLCYHQPSPIPTAAHNFCRPRAPTITNVTVDAGLDIVVTLTLPTNNGGSRES